MSHEVPNLKIIYKQKIVEEKEGNKMSNMIEKLTTSVKTDAVEVAWRTAGEKALDVSVGTVKSALQKSGLPQDVLSIVDSPFGHVLVGVLANVLVNTLGQTKNNDNLIHLVKEMELQALQGFLSSGITELQKPLIENLVTIAANLPSVEKLPTK